jgi:hypothetical protein
MQHSLHSLHSVHAAAACLSTPGASSCAEHGGSDAQMLLPPPLLLHTHIM